MRWRELNGFQRATVVSLAMIVLCEIAGMLILVDAFQHQ